VTGWAFGMGVERIVMLKYGIDEPSSSSSTTT
jgi:phenylalanyl-tRNA synthetase alpha subunit